MRPADSPAGAEAPGDVEIVKAVTESLLMEQEPVGKRITARIALSDTPRSGTTAPAPMSRPTPEGR
jgi:hypothetical protein